MAQRSILTWYAKTNMNFGFSTPKWVKNKSHMEVKNCIGQYNLPRDLEIIYLHHNMEPNFMTDCFPIKFILAWVVCFQS